MSPAKNSDTIAIKHILIPISMMAFTMALLFAFQMTQILRDRDALHQTIARQEGPIQESQKINNQFGGLVIGTQKLAGEGNKSAQFLVERLKQVGVIPPARPPMDAIAPAPVPAATAMTPPGPIKP